MEYHGKFITLTELKVKLLVIIVVNTFQDISIHSCLIKKIPV